MGLIYGEYINVNGKDRKGAGGYWIIRYYYERFRDYDDNIVDFSLVNWWRQMEFKGDIFLRSSYSIRIFCLFCVCVEDRNF